MKGHIRSRGPNVWELKFDLAADDGRRKTKYVTFKGTKRQAQDRLNKLMTQAQEGELAGAPATLTVSAYLATWFKHIRTQVSAKTAERYEQIARVHLIPTLGAGALIKVSPGQIEAAHATALAAGWRGAPRPDGSTALSARTVHHHHRVLSAALGHAVRLGLIPRNPCERVEPPRPARTEMKTLDGAATGRLLDAAESQWFYMPVVLAVATGCRRGELLALRWADVDLDAATASIARTLEETDAGGLSFKEPKTERGRRRVDLPAFAVEALRRHRGRQAEERLRMGRDWQDHDLVCCDPLGRPLSPRRVSKAFRMLCRRLDLAVTFHGLRHGFASMLLASEIHPKVVQTMLGHSSIQVTIDTYSHLLPGMGRDAASKIDSAIRTHVERAPAKSG
ncbi:MAG TPA: tyrosine-type recombinase/integrase [Stellaceae bacterium]|jgi:integrase|nr:tyrosine-type recombinase/integrase [Stellaceae bacterium]